MFGLVSCCVDEVAAEHVGADCMVHYGRACLSPSKRLPLMYVFEKASIDVDKFTSVFRELYTDTQARILVLYDVRYTHAIGKHTDGIYRTMYLCVIEMWLNSNLQALFCNVRGGRRYLASVMVSVVDFEPRFYRTK